MIFFVIIAIKYCISNVDYILETYVTLKWLRLSPIPWAIW